MPDSFTMFCGSMSTLCAGCGHDSITAAIVRSFWELDMPPHVVAKMSGIGCSSKTPAYFVSGAHGFNSAHGRMPAIASGAAAANRKLHVIGVSGDGDSLSIGIGHLCHAIRRNVDMLYIIENNGVYGLTKGQFSASADLGTKSKKGESNKVAPIDPVLLALSIGCTFVARSFSGDKAELVPLIKAGMAHDGFALIDVISPCVTFNDHEGSTKSYLYTRRHLEAITPVDYVPEAEEILLAEHGPGGATDVRMHDGSVVRFRSIPEGYDPTNRSKVAAYLEEAQRRAEVPTGLLYLEQGRQSMHEVFATPEQALVELPFDKLCPGQAALDRLQAAYR
jgi:2-oxoglutarate ferredoxin oxidoreductase subunit beta